jgi:hypothetical protein
MRKRKEIVLVLSDGETWESFNSDITIGIVEWDEIEEDYFPIDSVTSAIKYGEDEGVTYEVAIEGNEIVDFVKRNIKE